MILQVSGGIDTLQSSASGLQSTTQGITSGPVDPSESKQKDTWHVVTQYDMAQVYKRARRLHGTSILVKS